ncbi:MAG: nucleotidyltransferase domain-containing protein [Acidobacteria bacterium]|nr:nucleotidyltransferase domain-containing protein [Acidobacteriota bacterium]
MVAADPIASEIVDCILAVGRPQKIILFGSRARSAHRPASDYDLLIIQPSTEPRYRRAVPYYRALAALPVEVDVVVYTPEEVADWSAVPQAFVTTALREGAVLYEGEG